MSDKMKIDALSSTAALLTVEADLVENEGIRLHSILAEYSPAELRKMAKWL